MTLRVTQVSPQAMGKANINGDRKACSIHHDKRGESNINGEQNEVIFHQETTMIPCNKDQNAGVAQLEENLDTWHSKLL